MTRVNSANAVNSRCLHDSTPPPTPRISQSMAFVRASDDAVVTTSPQNRPTDPIYMELDNVEVGTKIEIINLSKNPQAEFDSCAIGLDLTGRDVEDRKASIFLNNEQMQELDLQPGDMYQLRAVDQSGNASAAVMGEFEPDDWANSDVTETFSDGSRLIGRGASMSMLDGETLRKDVTARAVRDSRPPMILEDQIQFETNSRWSKDDLKHTKNIEKNLCDISEAFGWGDINALQLNQNHFQQIANHEDFSASIRNAGEYLAQPEAFQKITEGNGQISLEGLGELQERKNEKEVTLTFDRAVEPRTQVKIHNSRTGRDYNVRVGDDQKLNLKIDDIANGDPIFITPTDNEEVEGQTVQVVYSGNFDRGIAPSATGGLGVLLGGVL